MLQAFGRQHLPFPEFVQYSPNGWNTQLRNSLTSLGSVTRLFLFLDNEE